MDNKEMNAAQDEYDMQRIKRDPSYLLKMMIGAQFPNGTRKQRRIMLARLRKQMGVLNA